MNKVVVVAPTLNEQESIENFILSVLSQKHKLSNYDLELLISDSHSRDHTPEIVKKISSKHKSVVYLDVEGKGLGMGLIKGLDFAVEKMGADILITMEADLSNDPNEIPDFVRKIEKYDVVIGSRYVKGGVIANWSWWRKIFSKCANDALRIFAWAPHLHEFTNLYRAFKKEVWLDLKPKIGMHTGWLFVPAFAFEILGSQYKWVESPIIYFDRYGGRSKMRTLSYTKNLLHYALRFRFKKLFGK